jgi:hypothetical protein
MKVIKQSYEILYPASSCEEENCELPTGGFIREAKLIELAEGLYKKFLSLK